jgi:hypothetical protein
MWGMGKLYVVDELNMLSRIAAAGRADTLTGDYG